MVFLSVLTWVAHLVNISCHIYNLCFTIHIYVDSCMCFVPLLYLMCT